MERTYQTCPRRPATIQSKNLTRRRATVLPCFVQTVINIDAFTLPTALGLRGSCVVRQINYVAIAPFTILNYPLEIHESCSLVVAFRKDDWKCRYKLNPNIGELFPADSYAGQTIPVNFTLEFWDNGLDQMECPDLSIITTMSRARVIGEHDITTYDVQEVTRDFAYDELKTAVTTLPYSFDTDIKHLNN